MMISIRRQPLVTLLIAIAAAALLPGCSVGYYWQAASGQMRLSRQAVPLNELLEAENLRPELRSRLELTSEVLAFAHGTLALPDNGSYQRYVDTGRPYVVWNVVATPEFSLAPRTWCFPVAGCISYRGYFSAEAAQKFANRLEKNGLDVFVGGVRAYSTLGHFRDPVFNTMLGLSDDEFASLIFHELAHQLLYVDDDSAFNEGFASAVAQEGLARWRADRSGGDLIRNAEQEGSANALRIRKLLQDYRKRLRLAYAAQPVGETVRRDTKAKLLQQLQTEYRLLTADMIGPKPYGLLLSTGINNAVLAAMATYDDYVPAFEELLGQCDYALDCFYVEAEAIGTMKSDERTSRMEALISATSE